MGGEEVRRCREWNDDLKPFGLRFAVGRFLLFTLASKISAYQDPCKKCEMCRPDPKPHLRSMKWQRNQMQV